MKNLIGSHGVEMKIPVSDLEKRRQAIEKAICENERLQRRVSRAVARRKPIASVVPTIQTSPPQAEAGKPAMVRETPVRFTHDNAPIFMSGNLEELRVRSATPDQRRNRMVLLLVFMAVILFGVVYMLLA